MIEWFQLNYFALANIIIIDVMLAGDNAVIVGLAASRVKQELRSRVIFAGIAGAVVLRVLFAALATTLLAIVGLTLAGGLLLLWVCWKMYWQLTRAGEHRVGARGTTRAGWQIERPTSFATAVTQIIIADLSMSLDNVLAVAGAARGSPAVLVIGLAVAIVLMAVAANLIANILARHPWLSWIGLLVIVWVALDMIYEGSREVACAAWNGIWCAPDLMTLIRGLWH
jgi:YjbE family integral membrane protein